MKYAPLFWLLVASTAQANGWEWRRQPITAEDRCEIERIARLTPLSQCQLAGVIETERMAYNQQGLMQYHGVLPTPMPTIPTPCAPLPARRGIHRLIH